MKTWQAMVMSVGMVFAAAYAPKITDETLRNTTLAALATAAAGAAKLNSETDQTGARIPPPPRKKKARD